MCRYGKKIDPSATSFAFQGLQRASLTNRGRKKSPFTYQPAFSCLVVFLAASLGRCVAKMVLSITLDTAAGRARSRCLADLCDCSGQGRFPFQPLRSTDRDAGD